MVSDSRNKIHQTLGPLFNPPINLPRYRYEVERGHGADRAAKEGGEGEEGRVEGEAGEDEEGAGEGADAVDLASGEHAARGNAIPVNS